MNEPSEKLIAIRDKLNSCGLGSETRISFLPDPFGNFYAVRCHVMVADSKVENIEELELKATESLTELPPTRIESNGKGVLVIYPVPAEV